MADIRGLDIDKAVKGFALTNYIFKNDVTVSSTNGDAIRWYQETAADLTATSPSAVANVGALSTFPTLEVTWTRNTSYPRKYAAEGFLSMEDMKTADIDVMARTLLRLTRAVVKQVDTRIWDVMTEEQSATNINLVDLSTPWDNSSATIVDDILSGIQAIEVNDYDTSGAVLYVSPKDKRSILNWLIDTKGSSVPAFSSDRVKDGTLMEILGVRVKVSNNVTADYAALALPAKAVTWKSVTGTTAKTIDEPGIGTKIRVWEMGEAVLTDPKAVTLIKNTQT